MGSSATVQIAAAAAAVEKGVCECGSQQRREKEVAKVPPAMVAAAVRTCGRRHRHEGERTNEGAAIDWREDPPRPSRRLREDRRKRRGLVSRSACSHARCSVLSAQASSQATVGRDDDACALDSKVEGRWRRSPRLGLLRRCRCCRCLSVSRLPRPGSAAVEPRATACVWPPSCERFGRAERGHSRPAVVEPKRSRE